MRCCVVFCLFVCVGFGCVDGLKASDKGVCVSKHTTVKTRPKTVLVALSKWCGKKKCTVKQTRQQKYTVVTNRLMCCNGFVYTADTDSCAPVCSTGCADGVCVDPDVCHCASPLYLDPTTKNKCLTPTCDHTCVNSQCTINNTCSCLEDYVYFNSTHCAPNCTENFEINSSLACVPKCEDCVNGTCASPNVCECSPGYANVNGTCNPLCKPCVNGWCSAPGVCSCDEGFTRKSATECLPSCAGECRANGTCLVMASIPKTRMKTYQAQVPCNNGRAKCPKILSKPEKYMEKVPAEICCDQYDYNPDTDTCIPVCQNECVNGTCIAPDVCICKPPLILYNITAPHKCVHPVCDNPCVNGVCTGNNQCTCNDGYLLKEDGFTCAAQCTNCSNGDCRIPNVCECHDGYIKNNDQCTPECISNCSHGYCSAPNICTCDPGYEFKNGTCNAICETPCVNAECIAPNTCECLDGYKPKLGNKVTCLPECKNGCSNGFCTAPGICTCNPGYENNGNNCKPICEVTCVNATCVSPNTCVCLDGFESKNNKEICSPKCESCANGVCVKPNQCKCNQGYILTEEGCVPTCEEPCINGHCSGPNECTCNDGYTKNVTKPSDCYVPCICDGGTCNLEGECKCEHDMTLINGTCILTTPAEMSASTTTGLASLQMTWWVAGAVGLLLMVLVLVSISRIWHTRKDFAEKSADNGAYPSVAYTIPNTLIREVDLNEADEDASEDLLTKENNV